MIKFIKENWFKVGISLIIVLAIIYYFAFYLLSKNNSVLQKECETQAKGILSDFEVSSYSLGYTGFKQETHYNHKLNQCFTDISYTIYSGLYSGGRKASNVAAYTQPTDGESLVDVKNNINLASCKGFAYDEPIGHICVIGGKEATFQQYSDFAGLKMEWK